MKLDGPDSSRAEDEDIHADSEPMNKTRKWVLTALSPVFWFTMLLSFSLYMMHWRIVAETPSYAGADSFKNAYQICFFVGLLGTAAIQATFLQNKKEGLKKVWLANLVATIIYGPFFLLTLMMMV